MRSGYELDVYFRSKRFRKRLDFFRELGEGYDFAGTLFIVNQFRLMQYHYGVVRHYIQTGKYDPSKANPHQIEIIDYTNLRIVTNADKPTNQGLEGIDLKTPTYGIHLVLPPGIKQNDIIAFVKDKQNSRSIKAALNEAYKYDVSNKRAFRPETRIDDYLKMIDEIDKVGALKPAHCRDLSIDYGVDEADIRKLYKRLGSQNNPYLNPV